MAWEYRSQTWRLLDELKKNGHTILLLEQTPESKNIFEYKLPPDEEVISKVSDIRSQVILEDKNSFENFRIPAKNNSKNEQEFENEISDQKFDRPGVILVLGNEVTGISKNLMNYATAAVEIPMYGTKESLNVAVAFGIAIFALKAK